MPAPAHDVLVKDPRVVFVVLLDYLVGERLQFLGPHLFVFVVVEGRRVLS